MVRVVDWRQSGTREREEKMIKITEVSIDWSANYGNRPRLTIRATEESLPRDADRLWRRRDVIWYSELGGVATWLCHSGDDVNEGGFGGSTYVIRMEDGSSKTLVGPWSSRAGVVNGLGLGPVINCVLLDSVCARRSIGLLRSVVADAIGAGLGVVADFLPNRDVWPKTDAPDVRFPPGSRIALYEESWSSPSSPDFQEIVYEPIVILPNGVTWRKPQ